MIKPDIYIDTDCLLKNLKNGMELVTSTEEKGVGLNSLVVRSVAEILTHGLRESKVSFWHIVRDLTHSSTRQTLARSLKHIHDNRQRGTFWIYYTLVEGSLDSYMHSLVSDREVIFKNYLQYSLLRDNFCATKFILLLTSLAQINITPLDSTTCVGLRLEICKNNGGESTPSSGISSPGDSGLHDSMEEASDSVFLPNKLSGSESTLTPVEAAFSDCSLSSATEPPLAQTVQRRKRVSFHETVLGDGPKGTVWERRSCEIETMAWWKGGLTTEEKGQDALDMERPAPEGSEDPQSTETTETEKPKEEKTVQKLIKSIKRSYLMSIFPGPMKPEPDMEFDDEELYFEPIQVPRSIPGLERFFNTTIYKMYNMIDTNGISYLCFIARQEISFITLTSNQTINMHRILYKDMKYIGVGPSPEHITLQDGARFLLTTRGQDFCSWLDYAFRKETCKNLDFIRISPFDYFAGVMAKNELKVSDIMYTTWAVICDPFSSNDLTYKQHLMFSLRANNGLWEPALVEINSKCELELRPCSKNRNICLPLSECNYCDRCLSSERPYTFKLRFDRCKRENILYLATPDSHSMSSWMQAILLAVASKKNTTAAREEREGHHLVASDRYLTLINARDDLSAKVYSEDISCIYTGLAYVVLELDCHEIQDKANDWVLYFYSDEIKESFLSFLTHLRPDLIKVIYEHKNYNANWTKCENENRILNKQFNNIITYLTSL